MKAIILVALVSLLTACSSVPSKTEVKEVGKKCFPNQTVMDAWKCVKHFRDTP